MQFIDLCKVENKKLISSTADNSIKEESLNKLSHSMHGLVMWRVRMYQVSLVINRLKVNKLKVVVKNVWC